MKKIFIMKGIYVFLTLLLLFVMMTVENGMRNSNELITVQAKETSEAVESLRSYVTNMNLKGYVGNSIKNNINFWQINAYRENENIITQIANAQSNVNSFDIVLGTDYFGVDKCYSIQIHEHENSKSLGWTMKEVPSTFGDRDIRFSNDSFALTNWTGAKELWIFVDASKIPSKTSIRIAFEENAIGRESFSLIEGKNVILYRNGETLNSIVESGGYVELPAGFKGYITLPLNSNYFSRYWSEGGNGVLDLNKVVQFQLSVKGDSQMIGKTLYMDNFAIVGNVSGTSLPIDIDTNDTYKIVWDFEGLVNGSGYIGSSLQWYGEFVGKLLTGMAFSYKISPDEKLLEAAEEIINELYLSQGDDGYLGVYVGGARYSIETANWDLWNQYHCITGLLEWYKITENKMAFDIAKKCIDCIYEKFKDRSYIVTGGFETNRGIAHGYALMYQATKEEKYLKEAERIIIEDCKNNSGGWYPTALAGSHFYLSNNNRWEILHMIMTLGILYEETANEEYYEVMSLIWEDILRTDIHNGGGFTTNEGAQGSPYKEGVIETCCTIAWLAFTNEYYKYNKSVFVADEFEKSYYNAMLGSLLDNDKYCTYNTPMDGVVGTCGHYDGRRVSSQQDISFQYHSGSKDMNCCQANLARGLGQLSEWACVTEGDSLYLNYFGNCSIETMVGNSNVTITEKTNYPLDGKVDIEISGLESPKEFGLLIRVPSWAFGSTIIVDGERIVLEAGEYFEINKLWTNGDKIQLKLELSFAYWKGENEQAPYTSVYYGPILLTLDQTYAPDCDQDTLFSVFDFEKSTVSSGSSKGCMLFVDVPIGEKVVRLVDFASAGKYNGNSSPSTYWSWLSLQDAPQPTDDIFIRWFNSEKHNIYFDSNVLLRKSSYYEGEVVEFELLHLNEEIIDKVLINSEEISCNDGVYMFKMPNDDVVIEVKYLERNESNEESLALIIGSIIGGIILVGTCFTMVVIKKKKE